jgi:hypothetical protein
MAARRRDDRGGGAEDCGLDADDVLCCCRTAVVRAYGGMLSSGAAPTVALDCAIRVYRYHHPQATHAQAHDAVEAWVTTGLLH